MKDVRWENLVAALILAIAALLAAFLLSPPRYSAFAVADYAFVRLDRRSGEMLRCDDKECRPVATEDFFDEIERLKFKLTHYPIFRDSALLRQIFRRPDPREAMTPLYRAVVEEARRPHWYREGGVPDTVDGRFDMVASVLALVLLRLESDGPHTRASQALLTETFVDDMDGALRQMGIGDLMVGKHVGRMMGALGGRLAAYREALAGGDLDEAVRRNIFRDEDADAARVGHVAARLRAFSQTLPADTDALLGGALSA